MLLVFSLTFDINVFNFPVFTYETTHCSIHYKKLNGKKTKQKTSTFTNKYISPFRCTYVFIITRYDTTEK